MLYWTNCSIHFQEISRNLKWLSYCVQPRQRLRVAHALVCAAQQSCHVQRLKTFLPLPSEGHDSVVSASDVTPTECWLNVWCIWHTFLETLQDCRSRHLTGWIKPDFRETRVSRLFSVRQETKMPWRQTPSRKMKAAVFTNVTTSAYQGQLNAGFSKVCEIFKVCGIESLKYIREIYTPVCYYGDISTHRNVTLNEMNCDWLFDMSVKWPNVQALANESGHLFQTFSHQSEWQCDCLKDNDMKAIFLHRF